GSVRKALIHRSGPAGELLAAMEAYERGDWALLDQGGWDVERLAEAYVSATEWAEELNATV
ncbi:MAG TPA: diguanylate phosphodiesterase, partial [Gammaproteobacteria bacterium]|nr:diguanylate phosphodiesterase [Gammaproteobacteria bacterium]